MKMERALTTPFASVVVRPHSLAVPTTMRSLSPAIPPIALIRRYHHLSRCVSRAHDNWPTQRPTRETALKIPAEPISSDPAVKSVGLGEHMVTADAPGLILRVHAAKDGSLTRSWIVRVTVNGRRRKFGLGSYPGVTLAAARQKALDARRKLAEGDDPSVTFKRRQKLSEAARTLTLAKAIVGYLAKAARSYKNPKNDQIRERCLNIHFVPLHQRDVASITTSDVADILRKLAPYTAIRAHGAIRAVFDFAATTLDPHSVSRINPADPRRLRSVGWSPKPQSESKPHPALAWRAMPELVAELSKARDVVSACALFIIATGVRCQTARLAKWSDIGVDADTEKPVWTVPLADLKDGKHHKRPFIVPLNAVALEALAARRGRSSSRFVFSGSSGAPITDSDIVCLNRRLRRRHPKWIDADSKLPFTFHGARATFRTWVEEVRERDDKLAELSLGHKVHGDVAARYIRTGLVEERRALLDAWSRHLCGESAKIITLRQG